MSEKNILNFIQEHPQLESFLNEDLQNHLYCDKMFNKFAGFGVIIGSLVKKGSVIFPKHAPELYNYLLGFDFITPMEESELKDLIDVVGLKLDLEKYANGQTFKEHLLEGMKTSKEEADKIEENIKKMKEQVTDKYYNIALYDSLSSKIS